MARLFVSYSSNDKRLAVEIRTGLRKRGHHVAIDVDSLVPGIEWRRELRERLLLSDGVVVIVTEEGLRSPFVMSEVGMARASASRFLIPIVVGDTPIHNVIQDIFAIPLPSVPSRKDFDDAVTKIDEAVKVHLRRSAALHGITVPAGYEHLNPQVRQFCDDSPFERNVFVMMKFPDKTTMKTRPLRLLDDIWEVISSQAARYGLMAQRADQRTYHDQLWENICVYIIGSKYGIAVLEDEVASELNPNVALEYGFMKALDHPVALMRSSTFKHQRADLSAKLAKSFDIVGGALRPATLRAAVDAWLREQGLRRRRTRRARARKR